MLETLDSIIFVASVLGPKNGNELRLLLFLLATAALESESAPETGWDAGARVVAVPYEKLADRFSWSARRVDQLLRRLEAAGWIARHPIEGIVSLAPGEMRASELYPSLEARFAAAGWA